LYYVALHEVGHILGIGTTWFQSGDPAFLTISNSSDKFYNSENAVREYRKYFAEYDSLEYIPVEDDGGGGTAGSHPEEGDNNSHSLDDRTIGNTFYPGMTTELMTGWANQTDLPLSRITIGYLDDMNYTVDYSKADDYRGYTSSYLNNHITTAEYWKGQFNLNLTTSNNNNYSINTGEISTDLGTYEIRKTNNNNSYDNVEFNHELNGNNSPEFLSRANGDYTILESDNSNTFGSIILSTNQYSTASQGNWYISFPPQPVFNSATGLKFDITVGFGNIQGGVDEKFYIEVYNGTSWVELYSKDDIATESSGNRLIKHIVIDNNTLYDSVVTNNRKVKIRLRVEGFQKRDFLIIGAYFISEIY